MVASDDSQADKYLAQDKDVTISASTSKVRLVAGDTMSLYLDIKNTIDKPLVVYVYAEDLPQGVHVDFPNGQRVQLDGHELGYCSLVIHLDNYIDISNYDLSFKIMLNDPDRGFAIESMASNLVNIQVLSNVAGSENYNKFFGIFENNLPSVFGEAWFAAVVTLIDFFAVAYLLGFQLIPHLAKRFSKEGSR